MEDENLNATIAAVQAIPQVRKVEPSIEPQLHNDVARVLLGIDPAPGGNPAIGITLTFEDAYQNNARLHRVRQRQGRQSRPFHTHVAGPGGKGTERSP